MRIGITGSRGFIGKKVVERLALENHDVVAYNENINSWGSFRDTPAYEELKDCKLIIHLAGKNKGTDREIIETNLFGSLNLLNWAHFKQIPMMLAGTEYKQDGAYKHSKDTLKAMCRAYGFATGYTSCTLNLPKVIGPGCKPFYNSFVTTLIWAEATNQLKIYERNIKDLNEKLELIHVGDVCDIIVDLIDNPSSGFTEYRFNKLDRKFSITMQQALDSIKGEEVHDYSFMFHDLVRWYKENANG
jgi:UDP-2-acetamido-2,6-beta-L-arabino-hexul-4-ose reductase